MRTLAAAVLVMPVLAGDPGAAATQDLGNGFHDHGVGTPISNHRGTVATARPDGTPLVLSWLYDCRGGYGLLELEANSGQAKVHDTPYPWAGDGPFASILSKANRYYTHFGSHFSEFDPAAGKFTFFQKTVPQMAMSMCEDDQGRIWSATYPNSAVACYDPATKAFKDYGSLYKQNWSQYPRSIAADDTGHIYFGIGSTKVQVISLDPATGAATPLVPEAERVQGAGTVTRDRNGKVYASIGKDRWLELYRGVSTELAAPPKLNPLKQIAGSQGLFHTVFPDGRLLQTFDLVERQVAIKDPKSGQVEQHAFDYPSEGAHIMGVATASNGTIAGGTAFPMRFFAFDPKSDSFERHPAYGQWNTIAPLGDRFFVGGYGHGYMLEWDPAKPWVNTVKGQADCNPRHLAEAEPDINRPHDLLAHPDGRWVILAGTPGYGYTGGGLLFWDRQEQKSHLVKHQELIPEHSTCALAALPDGTVVGGTTVSPGTGGERKATVAELYLLDPATRRITWHAPLLPGVSSYLDFWVAPDGLVYGIADRTRLFVFDPRTKSIVHEAATGDLGPTASQQGCRIFVPAPDGRVFMLFAKGPVQLDPATRSLKLLATAPVAMTVGGDWHDGRIYYANGSHVYSWVVPPAAP